MKKIDFYLSISRYFHLRLCYRYDCKQSKYNYFCHRYYVNCSSALSFGAHVSILVLRARWEYGRLGTTKDASVSVYVVKSCGPPFLARQFSKSCFYIWLTQICLYYNIVILITNNFCTYDKLMSLNISYRIPHPPPSLVCQMW